MNSFELYLEKNFINSYKRLRENALQLKSKDVHHDFTVAPAVYGVVIDTKRKNVDITYVLLIDGTASVYSSDCNNKFAVQQYDELLQNEIINYIEENIKLIPLFNKVNIELVKDEKLIGENSYKVHLLTNYGVYYKIVSDSAKRNTLDKFLWISTTRIIQKIDQVKVLF